MNKEEKIKEYAIFPGQIKVDNEVFFGIDYKITDLFNQISEENKKQKEVLDKIKPMLKELNIKLKDILNIGIDIKEISDILELLEEIE